MITCPVCNQPWPKELGKAPDVSSLTPRQKQILDFLSAFRKEKGYSPSFEEIGTHFKIKVATVHEHLQMLRIKRFVRMERHAKRSVRVIVKRD